MAVKNGEEYEPRKHSPSSQTIEFLNKWNKTNAELELIEVQDDVFDKNTILNWQKSYGYSENVLMIKGKSKICLTKCLDRKWISKEYSGNDILFPVLFKETDKNKMLSVIWNELSVKLFSDEEIKLAHEVMQVFYIPYKLNEYKYKEADDKYNDRLNTLQDNIIAIFNDSKLSFT